jgi:Carboxypeptidase regulatory-like domain
MKTSDRVFSVASLLLVLVFGQLLTSCSQTSTLSSIQPGSVTGVAILLDSVANQLPSSAGVNVTLDNSNYMTQTDSTGFWKIDNVASGNYDITVSKTGFGLCIAYGVTIEGPGTTSVTPQMQFAAAPTVAPVISNLAIHEGDTGSVTAVVGAISSANNYPDIMIFMDLSPNVQPGDAHLLWEFNGNGFDWSVDAIHQAGIPSGTTVYVSSCEMNFASVWHRILDDGGSSELNATIISATYNDPVDNSTHFITTGPKSNVVAITIP